MGLHTCVFGKVNKIFFHQLSPSRPLPNLLPSAMANPSCTGTCPCTPTSPQSLLLPNVSHSLPSYSRTTGPLRKLSVIILCILTESRTPASLQINTPHIEYHSKSQEDLPTSSTLQPHGTRLSGEAGFTILCLHKNTNVST